MYPHSRAEKLFLTSQAPHMGKLETCCLLRRMTIRPSLARAVLDFVGCPGGLLGIEAEVLDWWYPSVSYLPDVGLGFKIYVRHLLF